VFSNELFDAQPFRRFVFRAGHWREIAVQLVDNRLREVELTCTPLPGFPSTAPESYVIDAPLAAAQLVEKIGRQAWTGVFVACDYGKSWRELVESCPAGTARAYYRHRQSNGLLARPGEQDLTCHVCWDWLSNALVRTGFPQPTVDSHETFFITHSRSVIAEISTTDAARFSQRKLSLMQLLHPSHLGQKFQVLHASRY
jgi:SAM-dependent MidA family methyltransferase